MKKPIIFPCLQKGRLYVKYMMCVLAAVASCYGFWGCLFPDLTLTEGTYRIVEVDAAESEVGKSDAEREEASLRQTEYKHIANAGVGVKAADLDAEALYTDIMTGRVKISCRSKLVEIISKMWIKQ